MNREILFRGLRADGKGWVEGGFTLDAAKQPRITTVHKSGEGLVFHNVIPETACQFTGLTDKNNVKVFEGDEIDGGARTGIVVWYKCGWYLKYKSFEGNKYYVRLDQALTNNPLRIVIGNIHDKTNNHE